MRLKGVRASRGVHHGHLCHGQFSSSEVGGQRGRGAKGSDSRCRQTETGFLPWRAADDRGVATRSPTNGLGWRGGTFPAHTRSPVRCSSVGGHATPGTATQTTSCTPRPPSPPLPFDPHARTKPTHESGREWQGIFLSLFLCGGVCFQGASSRPSRRGSRPSAPVWSVPETATQADNRLLCQSNCNSSHRQVATSSPFLVRTAKTEASTVPTAVPGRGERTHPQPPKWHGTRAAHRLRWIGPMPATPAHRHAPRPLLPGTKHRHPTDFPIEARFNCFLMTLPHVISEGGLMYSLSPFLQVYTRNIHMKQPSIGTPEVNHEVLR